MTREILPNPLLATAETAYEFGVFLGVCERTHVLTWEEVQRVWEATAEQTRDDAERWRSFVKGHNDGKRRAAHFYSGVQID